MWRMQRATQLFRCWSAYPPKFDTQHCFCAWRNSAPLAALALLATMRCAGIRPNVITFTAVICPSEKGKLPEQALESIDAMQQQGLSPNAITYNALFSALEKSK